MKFAGLPEVLIADPARLRPFVLKNYQGPDVGRESFQRTFAGRNAEITERIDEIVSTLPHAPRILFIGLGVCKYGTGTVGAGAVELAGVLEGHGRTDYKMTVLDIDDSLLDRFVDQRVIHTRRDANEDNASQLEAYARRVGVEVRSRGTDLSAPVSDLFLQKIENGDISAVQGDLVKIDLKALGKFDLIHCLNVLTHLDTGEYEETENPFAPFRFPENDERLLLALYNLVGALNPSGSLFVDQTAPCGECDQWYFHSSEVVSKIVARTYPAREIWSSPWRVGLLRDNVVQIQRD